MALVSEGERTKTLQNHIKPPSLKFFNQCTLFKTRVRNAGRGSHVRKDHNKSKKRAIRPEGSGDSSRDHRYLYTILWYCNCITLFIHQVSIYVSVSVLINKHIQTESAVSLFKSLGFTEALQQRVTHRITHASTVCTVTTFPQTFVVP